MNELIEGLMKDVALLKRRVDNLVKPEVSRWQDWTPTVTQSGSVTVTVTFARYSVSVKTVHLRARLTITGTGTAGNNIIISNLPQSISNAVGVIGTIRIVDTGTATYVGTLAVSGATSVLGIAHNTLNAGIGANPSFALANGDIIDIEGSYERG